MSSATKRRSVNSPQCSKFQTKPRQQPAKLPPAKIEALDFRDQEGSWLHGPSSFSLLSFCTADPDTLVNSSGGVIPSLAHDEVEAWEVDVESLWTVFVGLRPYENHQGDALTWFTSFLTSEQVREWLPSGDLLVLTYFDDEDLRMDLVPMDGDQPTKLSRRSSRIHRPDADRARA